MPLPIIGIAASALVGGAVSVLSFGAGTGDYLTRTIYDIFPARINDVSTLVRNLQKGTITPERFTDWMRQNGYDTEARDYFVNAATSGLSVSEILTLWFRYKDNPSNAFGISEKWLDESMRAASVSEGKQKILIEAARPVPTLDDIISFTVRDAFEPEVVARGGLDEGLPERFVQEAAKRGLDRNDAILYWRSHWNFPSLNQAFEMFQRLYDHPDPSVRFTREDMDALFNVADIAPRMRARLQAIAYNPTGRVDIRRFDSLGIYGEGEERRAKLTRAYRELGYNPKDAGDQAEFTIRLNDRTDRDFTRAQILQLYRAGLPKDNTRKFAEEELAKLGFTPDKIKLTLDLEDQKIIDTEEQAQIDALIERYVLSLIPTQAGLRTELFRLDLSPEQVNKIVAQAEKEKDAQAKRVSMATADKLLRAQLIDAKQWRDIYKYHGIVKQDIDAVEKLLDRPDGVETRQPSKDDIVKWFTSGLIPPERFTMLMRDIGFDDEFILLYGQSVQPDYTLS